MVRGAAILALMTGLSVPATAKDDPSALVTRDQVLSTPPPLVLADRPQVLALVRIVTPPAQKMPIRLLALEADTLEEQWHVDGLGDFLGDMGPRFTHLARIADLAVVAQPNRVVRALDLEDGEVRWTVELTDRPTSLCVHELSVYVGVLDEKHTRIEPGTGQSVPVEALPEGCTAGGVQGPVGPDGQLAFALRKSASKPSLVPAGQAFDHALLDASGEGMAVLVKRPGTPLPHVARVQDGAITWSRTLFPSDPFAPMPEAPQHVALTPDVAYVAYRLRLGQARVQAVDRRTGAVRWDVEVPHSEHAIESLQVRGDRVYVGHWTYLEALDATTGEGVGTIGMW